MSDHYIFLVPTDPYFAPTRADASRACALVREFVESKKRPFPCEIKSVSSKRPAFHSSMGNFESVFCPHCNTEQSIDWWQTQMDRDFDGRFVRSFSRFPMPCCAKEADLNTLRYEFPQAFGRFAISCMNPNIGKFSKQRLAAIERILGCQVRQILAHV